MDLKERQGSQEALGAKKTLDSSREKRNRKDWKRK
jgi:hypothetical protein